MQTKTSLFWQMNAIHLNRHQKRVPRAIERKQFRFSVIECHKLSVTPFHNTMQVQVHQPISPKKKTYQDWKSGVICIDPYPYILPNLLNSTNIVMLCILITAFIKVSF